MDSLEQESPDPREEQKEFNEMNFGVTVYHV